MKKKNTLYPLMDEFTPYLNEMEDCSAKHYVTQRLIKQIEWYDKESGHNQTYFKKITIISIVMSSLIPVITLLSDLPFGLVFKILITLLSSGITAISAVGALYKFGELWIQYRTICETLKSTLHRYFLHCGEFCINDPNQANNILIQTCEAYINMESQKWALKRPENKNTDHSSTAP